MTSALRPRNLIIGIAVITAAIGGVVLRSFPAVPVRTASAAHADTPEVIEPATFSDDTTSTTTGYDFNGRHYQSIDDSHRDDGYEGGETPSTTSTSIKELPPVDQSQMHRYAPTATLHTQYGVVNGEGASSCWRMNDHQALCACGPSGDPETSIDAEPGETVTITFDREDSPRTATYTLADSYDGESLDADHMSRTEASITMPTRPGIYWMNVSTWWPEGDVTQTFKVVVKGTMPANAKGAILGRVGGDPSKATLSLTGPAGRTIEIKPDDVGRYRFDGLPAGTYTLQADMQSYAPWNDGENGVYVGTAATSEVREVTITAGEIHREDFDS